MKPNEKKPRESRKVRATEAGEYGLIYRNVGDVFTITPREIPLVNKATGKAELDEHGKLKTIILSIDAQMGSWMEVVDENTPERITTSQQEIDRQIKALNSGAVEHTVDDEAA